MDLRVRAEGLVVLETAEKNMEIFTKKEIECAKLARAVQRRIGHHADKHMKNIVSQRSLKNIPIIISDIANTEALFGTSVPGLKGWATRKKVRGFPVDRVSIPAEFYQLNKFVTIAAGVMFVSGVPFFVTYIIEEDKVPDCGTSSSTYC